MNAGLVEVETRRDQLLSAETFLGQSLLLVFLRLIEDVIKLVRKNAPQGSPVQLVGALSLAGFHGGLNRTLHAVTKNRTEGLNRPVNRGAVGQSAAASLWPTFINEKGLNRDHMAIPLEMDHDKIGEGVTWLEGLKRRPVELDWTAPNFGEFGLEGFDDVRLGGGLVKGNHEGYGFQGPGDRSPLIGKGGA